MNITSRWAVLGLLGLVLWPGRSTADAQRFPVIAGGDVRVGVVWPQTGDRGIGAGADLDLGGVLPGIRIIAGLQGFNAGVDRLIGGERVTGDIAARGGRVAARFAPLGAGMFSPYLVGGLTAYHLSADADLPDQQPAIRQLYSGTVIGTSLGAGAVYPLEPTQQLLAVLEGRREWVGNIDHWALEVGVRVRLREPDPRFPAR